MKSRCLKVNKATAKTETNSMWQTASKSSKKTLVQVRITTRATVSEGEGSEFKSRMESQLLLNKILINRDCNQNKEL